MIYFCLLLAVLIPNFSQAQDWQQKYSSYKSQMPREIEQQLIDQLKNTQVLFITGILAQSTYQDAEKQIRATVFFGEYYQEIMAWLSSKGVSHQRIKLESEESPQFNAQSIRTAIRNAKKPVLIFSHSKGGLDFLEAMKQEPALTSKVRAWITSQSPLWGSSIAEILFEDVFPRWLVEPFVNIFFNGSFDGVRSLTRSIRRQVMQSPEYQALFSGPLKRIPKLSFSSFGKQQGLGPSHVLEPLRLIMQSYEGPNDGVVSLTSSYVPNSISVVEEGVDHISTVVDCYIWKKRGLISEKIKSCQYDRLSHTKALMQLAFEIKAQ